MLSMSETPSSVVPCSIRSALSFVETDRCVNKVSIKKHKIHTMSAEIDISDIFQNDAMVIRKTLGNPPRISIMDFVMAVTGQNNDRAAKTIRNLKDVNSQFLTKLEMHQFPGRSQREQYVLCASEAIQLLMMLPGKVAREFRLESANLLTKVFAGDPDIHRLLEENSLSDGPLQQMCRAEVNSNKRELDLMAPDPEMVAIKRRIVMEKLQQELDVTRIGGMKQLVDGHLMGMSASKRKWLDQTFENYVIDIVFRGENTQQITNGEDVGGMVYTNDDAPYTIADYLLEIGVVDDVHNVISKAIGLIASRIYLEEYGSRPVKKDVYLHKYSGPRGVNQYTKRDKHIIAEAYTEYCGGVDIAKKQKDAKDLKAKEAQDRKEVKDKKQSDAKEKKDRASAEQPRMDTFLKKQLPVPASPAYTSCNSDEEE
jgi:hypothetical protein